MSIKDKAKQQAGSATVAAVVATLASAGMQAANPPPTKVVEKPTYVTVSGSRYAWPVLTDAQVGKLRESLKWLKGQRVMIFCGGADCRDLQTQLDNILEDVGANSSRETPVMALGYGFGVVAKNGDDRADKLAKDVSAATDLKPKVDAVANFRGPLSIAIGKKPRAAGAGD